MLEPSGAVDHRDWVDGGDVALLNNRHNHQDGHSREIEGLFYTLLCESELGSIAEYAL